MKYNKSIDKSFKDDNYNKLIDNALDNKKIRVSSKLLEDTISKIKEIEPENQNKKRNNIYIIRVLASVALLTIVITASFNINLPNKKYVQMKDESSPMDICKESFDNNYNDEEFVYSDEKVEENIQDDRLEENVLEDDVSEVIERKDSIVYRILERFHKVIDAIKSYID
ncbi:MAG TPA: hypothetical protein GXZ90_09300 [Clostridiales bacterium]|nr:hypothetical protein [Clostridiales bacterium]